MDEHNTTIESVCGFLEADGFHYRMCEDELSVELGFTGQDCRFLAMICVVGDPPRSSLLVLVRNPVVVPEEYRRAVAEAIIRANYGHVLGCFDLDMSDGELLFRASMPLNDGMLAEDQCRSLLYSSFAAADRYNRAFNRLVYGDDTSPAEVIAEVEMAD